mmetsp:Transcript_14411/g.43661  ORF Transcript_14411/g.43661 Transcript_14411/m.43661 type:complete len:240 (-) Transcript_14411:144-863(-)
MFGRSGTHCLLWPFHRQRANRRLGVPNTQTRRSGAAIAHRVRGARGSARNGVQGARGLRPLPELRENSEHPGSRPHHPRPRRQVGPLRARRRALVSQGPRQAPTPLDRRRRPPRHARRPVSQRGRELRHLRRRQSQSIPKSTPRPRLLRRAPRRPQLDLRLVLLLVFVHGKAPTEDLPRPRPHARRRRRQCSGRRKKSSVLVVVVVVVRPSVLLPSALLPSVLSWRISVFRAFLGVVVG